MFFLHESQMDHLRPSDARAQIYLDAPHDVRFVAQQRRTSFRSEEKVYTSIAALPRDLRICSHP